MRASLPDVAGPAVTPIAAAWRPLALAASVAFVALLSWNVWTFTLPDERSVGLAPEILSAHLRSLMANHLTDVASSDQHTVEAVVQRQARPIAARHRSHGAGDSRWSAGGSTISISGRWRRWSTGTGCTSSICSSGRRRRDEQASTTVALTRNGYNLLHWHDKGLAFWAVSDVAAADLGVFEKLIRDQSPRP